MSLEDARKEIDAVDAELVSLYVRRMRAAGSVAAAKRAQGGAVRDSAREQVVLDRAATAAGPEFADGARRLFSLLMELSRARQEALLGDSAGDARP